MDNTITKQFASASLLKMLRKSGTLSILWRTQRIDMTEERTNCLLRLVRCFSDWWSGQDEEGITGKECAIMIALQQLLMIPFYIGWILL
jgi:hypothetical protein